jgi:dTDP-4-dehydrorhamnose 3,5-epimerase
MRARDMQSIPTRLSGAIIIEVPAFADERGFFKETYVNTKYQALGIPDDFVQDNVSFSRRGVLRGLHGDPQMSKLVYVLQGHVFDVMVDARKGSPTFGQWEGVHLRADEHTQLYIPAGCLHGFLALSDDVVFCYKQSAEYAPEREIGVRWDDPDIGIEWPLTGAPVISQKDLRNRAFRDVFGNA